MAVRTSDQWREILEGLLTNVSPKSVPDATHIVAGRVMGDLAHYREGGAWEADDMTTLANAFEAYASMKTAKSFAALERLNAQATTWKSPKPAKAQPKRKKSK